jgi:hypothetical protein
MIISWRILFLTVIGRCYQDLSCELFYEKDEWVSAWQIAFKEKPPSRPPSINVINRIVATVGGFLNRKSDSDPGIKVMWTGLQTLRHYTEGYIAFKQAYICG